MNQKIEKLLSILCLSEEKQQMFLNDYFTKLYFNTDKWPYWYGICDILMCGDSSEQENIFTHLAFRLRDEFHYAIGSIVWDKACWEVWGYIKKQMGSDILEREHLSYETKLRYCTSWVAFWAKPIHWIIISLIAKELINDGNAKWEIEENVLKNHKKDSKDGEGRNVPMYAIGQDDGKGGYGMWDGPNPSEQDMLNVDGRDENSAIIRFNVDGTDDLIYRWDGDEWIKVNEGCDDGR